MKCTNLKCTFAEFLQMHSSVWFIDCHHLQKLPHTSFLAISARCQPKTTVLITFYHRLASGHHMNGTVWSVFFFIEASFTQHEGFILLLQVSVVCFSFLLHDYPTFFFFKLIIPHFIPSSIDDTWVVSSFRNAGCKL